MKSLNAIQAAIEQLAPDQRAAFRAWFDALDARDWDKQMEADSAGGRLDWLLQESVAELEQGHATDR